MRLNNVIASVSGYSEILIGEAHDDVIKSNDPYAIVHDVLEAMRERFVEPRKGRHVGSWARFNDIVGIPKGNLRQCGQEPLAGPDHQLLNLLQAETSIRGARCARRFTFSRDGSAGGLTVAGVVPGSGRNGRLGA